jgi:integrase
MRVTEPYIIFPRTLPSGRIVYYYQYRDSEGRRSNPLSTGETVLSRAKRKIQKMYNDGAFETKSDNITFEQFTKDFFSKTGKYYEYQALTSRPIKDSTLASYNKFLNNQLMPFFRGKRMLEINKDCVKDWVLWASKLWAAKTINNAHGVLNIIFESALEKEIISRNPLSGMKFRPTEKKERKLLTVEEIRQIYNSGLWARETQRKMFLLAAITGMRIGEISALQKTDIHENYIDIKHTYSDKFGLGTTKTGECRKVPVVGTFDFGSSHSEWVFEGLTSDKPMMSHAVYNCFSRICDKLKIDRIGRGVTIHSLRNFFISYLQGENVPESKIKAVAGHKDKSNMTEHYTYWKPEMFPEVYEAQKKLYDMITGDL